MLHVSTALMCVSLGVSLGVSLDVAAQNQSEPSLEDSNQSLGVIREIIIQSTDIFGDGSVPTKWVPRAINFIHIITKQEVIGREVWLAPGDSVSRSEIEELERILRKTDLFAKVDVQIAAVEEAPEKVDLLITSRDRLSTIFSAGGSFLGGVAQVAFAVGEKNVLGLGHRFVFGYAENSEDELLGSVAYDNVLLYDTDVYGGLRYGRTEEGRFSNFRLENRFQNSLDHHSWLINYESDEIKVDYYEQSESVAEVPRQTTQFQLMSQVRRGSLNRSSRIGPVVTWRETSYSEASGVNAASVDIPDDQKTLFIGALYGLERQQAFREVTWLDTLDFEQDLSIGYGAELLFGAQYKTTDSTSRTHPQIALNAWNRNEVGKHSYLSTKVRASATIDDSNLTAWLISAGVSGFDTRFRNQTLAVRFRYLTASDDEGLPPEQSLGENNGLRGYPSREFNGEQSLYVNIEDRLRTPISLYSFNLGLLGFLDSGWVSDRGLELGKPHSSVGIGLRIGSRAILGKAVIRLDFAYPFDDDPARSYEPTVSLAVGQVFGFVPF